MVFCAFPVVCAPAVFIGEWVHCDCIQKGDTDLGMAYSLGAFGGVLLERCICFSGKPWDTGADFSNFNCGSAFLETTDVALHSRRDDLLYGFSTDCFLRGKQSFLVV